MFKFIIKYKKYYIFIIFNKTLYNIILFRKLNKK